MQSSARWVSIAGLFLLFLCTPSAVWADVSCSGSVNYPDVPAGGTIDFSITVNNTGASDINWIRVTKPSNDFTINRYSLSGWSASDSDMTFTGGPLTPTNSIGVNVNFVTDNSVSAPSADWGVLVSADGGNSQTGCLGSLGTSISNSNAPPSPAMSNLVVSNVTDSSVSVSWNTDLSSDSKVQYGTDANYGSEQSDSGQVTGHSLSITGLSANTVYHYHAMSSNANGTADSGDNSFTTAQTGYTGTSVTGTVTTITTTVTKFVGPTPTPTPVPDRTPPSATLLTDFTKPFAAAPTIKGKATDPSGVSGKMDYSLDDGKSWSPVDTVDDPGASSTTFSFTPVGLLDDNYILRIRTTDGKGNTGVSLASWTMVIDRLPPMIGGSILTIGPEVIPPGAQGTALLVAGLHPKLTVSAVGGPTKITLLSNGQALGDMQKNSDTGLWSMVMPFDTPGTYQLSTHAIDGAGNVRDRVLNTIVVQSGGIISNGKHPISGAKVAVYALDPATGRFVSWDAAAYGQVSPQKTDVSGTYTFSLPHGSYYLRISGPGYRQLVTNIFVAPDAYPLTAHLMLLPARSFRLGPWTIPLPDFRQDSASITITNLAMLGGAPVAHPIGADMPYFSFPMNDTKVESTGLHGKPTVITFLNSWSPQTSQELEVLDSIAANKEINSLVIMPQETVSSVAIFRKRGAYHVPIVADPDGTLVEPLNIVTIPSHIFLDRKGSIQSVVSGVLSKQEILDHLVQ